MELDAIDRRNLEDSVLETVVYPTESGLHEGPVAMMDLVPLLPDVRAVDLSATLTHLVSTGLLRRLGNSFEVGSPAAIERASLSLLATCAYVNRRPSALPPS